MAKKKFIEVKAICSQYEVEYSFVHSLSEIGLIELQIIEEHPYLHQDQVGDLEKMIRLHTELHVNLEGIDVVFNLLKQEQHLRDELIALKNRLRRYEDDF